MTCYSCKQSAFPLITESQWLLRCMQTGELIRNKHQAQECPHYEREPGADEPKDVC